MVLLGSFVSKMKYYGKKVEYKDDRWAAYSFLAFLSMEFSRQEYCSGLPCPSPGDLTNLLIEPGSSALQADSLPSEPSGKPLA